MVAMVFLTASRRSPLLVDESRSPRTFSRSIFFSEKMLCTVTTFTAPDSTAGRMSLSFG
jgi:hypothetical protein